MRPVTPKPVEGNQTRPAPKEDEDNRKEIEVYYEPAKRDANGIIISCVNTTFE